MNSFKRDFTFRKYTELCHAMKESGYTIYNLRSYLLEGEENVNTPFVILRHDVDNRIDTPYALKMAEFERLQGISSTYYFRTVPSVLNEQIISRIAQMGHEIGYHYEVMNETHGDAYAAVELFQRNLKKLRKICEISTIAQHGGFLGNHTATTFVDLLKVVSVLVRKRKGVGIYESKKLWEKFDFKKFGIIGEAYLSLDFNKIVYFSDTGLRWDAFRDRLQDTVVAPYYSASTKLITTTNDFIELIAKRKIERMCILVHPPNWRDKIIPWTTWHLLQIFRNSGKRLFKSIRT